MLPLFWEPILFSEAICAFQWCPFLLGRTANCLFIIIYLFINNKYLFCQMNYFIIQVEKQTD